MRLVKRGEGGSRALKAAVVSLCEHTRPFAPSQGSNHMLQSHAARGLGNHGLEASTVQTSLYISHTSTLKLGTSALWNGSQGSSIG
jgi:hypothetical protein